MTEETHHLRRAMGGYLAHAVPSDASYVSGRAACGFKPSGKPKYIVERHGWEGADRLLIER